MAQFVVRHLEDDVAEKLKQRARRHARSMEDEVRHILARPCSSARARQKLGLESPSDSAGGADRRLAGVRGVAARAADLDS